MQVSLYGPLNHNDRLTIPTTTEGTGEEVIRDCLSIFLINENRRRDFFSRERKSLAHFHIEPSPRKR